MSFCKVIKRVCAGSVVTSTDLVTGLPLGLYGLRMAYGTTTNVYLFKEMYVTQLLSTITNFFTPARVGFYFAKQAADSTGHIAGFYPYGDSLVDRKIFVPHSFLSSE